MINVPKNKKKCAYDNKRLHDKLRNIMLRKTKITFTNILLHDVKHFQIYYHLKKCKQFSDSKIEN